MDTPYHGRSAGGGLNTSSSKKVSSTMQERDRFTDSMSALLSKPLPMPGDGGTLSPTDILSNSALPPMASREAQQQPTQQQQFNLEDVMEDPVTMLLMLSKHREGLNLTLREVNALKAVIQGQEQAIEKLQQERGSLLQQITEAKETEFELVQQIQQLTTTCEELTGTIQRRGVENAARLNALESQKRESELTARTVIDRLETQLYSTQHPQSSARPLPWNRVSAIEGHPAMVLKECVLQDARREECFLSRNVPVADEDDVLLKLKEHSKPPINAKENRKAGFDDGGSEDEALWRNVVGRIYSVLNERRNWLHTTAEIPPSPVEFLLRTRHQLVSEVCHLHRVVSKCNTLVAVLFDRLESIVSASGGQAIGGQVELVSAVVSDMDATLQRIKLSCFSAADCAFHNVNQLGVTPTAFTQGRPLLPGGPSVQPPTAPLQQPPPSAATGASGSGKKKPKQHTLGGVASAVMAAQHASSGLGSSANRTTPKKSVNFSSPSAKGAEEEVPSSAILDLSRDPSSPLNASFNSVTPPTSQPSAMPQPGTFAATFSSATPSSPRPRSANVRPSDARFQ